MSNVVKAAWQAPGMFRDLGGRTAESLTRLASDVTGVLATTPATAVEQVDVGAPVDVAYDAWVRFQEGSALLAADEVVHEVLDERIVWDVERRRGYVEGGITFHELVPGLTRLLVVLAGDPPGLLERVLRRGCGLDRRLSGELERYRRQVMTRTLIETEEPSGNGELEQDLG